MTDTNIKELVKTIEKATQDALQSKEKALKFLQDAGIANKKNGNSNNSSSKKTDKKK
jgi:hypothetical protein